mmetsp:Transcript_11970/g.26403  ORF Transcript_11970/g.26403 Transcript_11970/m.26403 type:complete len:759 (+) Transcript_11970:254-2530(+)
MEYDKLLPNKDEKADGDADFLAMDRRRRSYELCLVFRCKPDKGIRDPIADRMEERPELREGTAAEKQKIDVLRQRREAILKSLQNCGLRLFCYYSRDRDEVLVKIGAPPQKLRDTAARMKYKLQLKKQYLNAYAEYRHDFAGTPERGLKDRRVVSHIYKTHTEDDFPDSDAIFKSLDKIQLIHRIISSKDKDCAGVNIGKLIYDGEVTAYFPLHEASTTQFLKENRHQWFWMEEDFANQMHDYFGDRIAFHFLFMAYYWKWLLPIAVLGLCFQFVDLIARTPDNMTAIPFCIFMSVWSIFMPHFWRRQEAKYAIGWGTLNLEEKLEPCRPEHHGEPRINPVTAQIEPFYPPERRRLDYFFSLSMMAVVGGAAVTALLGLIYWRHHYREHSPGGMWFFQLGIAAYVEIVNGLLTRLSVWLTTRENHRTQTEHEWHALSKVLLFKFLNSYLVLFYTAFFKEHHWLFGTEMKCWEDDCFGDLSWQLAIFVFFRLTFTNVYEYVEPRVKLWWRSMFLEKRAFWQTLQTALNGTMLLEVAAMSPAEQQSKRDRYDEFRNCDEILLSHGFATFFAVTSPWVCAATLVAMLVEIGLDMKMLTDHQQRPMPRLARNNDPWSVAFDIYGFIASGTNILLLIFASEEYNDWTLTEKLVLFVWLEHMLVLSRVALHLVFPQVPKNVELLQLKQEHMVHRCLENIKVEQAHDFSMFRDKHTDNVDIFENDILERDDDNEAEVEPTLNLGASARSMVDGLTEAKTWLPSSN